jgi:CRISPR-associated protein Csb1
MYPFNLVGAVRHGSEDWDFVAVEEKARGEKKAGEKLSEIGHGNVAPNPQHGGVTISSASRSATLSLAGLDRIGFGGVSAQAATAARMVLAAYALVADRLAFGAPSLWLRSGCELVLVEERLEWVSRGGAVERFELPADKAVEVLQAAVLRAGKEGMAWSTETVQLVPTPALAKAIEFSLTKAAAAGD